jgi:hypothetical protein
MKSWNVLEPKKKWDGYTLLLSNILSFLTSFWANLKMICVVEVVQYSPE